MYLTCSEVLGLLVIWSVAGGAVYGQSYETISKNVSNSILDRLSLGAKGVKVQDHREFIVDGIRTRQQVSQETAASLCLPTFTADYRQSDATNFDVRLRATIGRHYTAQACNYSGSGYPKFVREDVSLPDQAGRFNPLSACLEVKVLKKSNEKKFRDVSKAIGQTQIHMLSLYNLEGRHFLETIAALRNFTGPVTTLGLEDLHKAYDVRFRLFVGRGACKRDQVLERLTASQPNGILAYTDKQNGSSATNAHPLGKPVVDCSDITMDTDNVRLTVRCDVMRLLGAASAFQEIRGGRSKKRTFVVALNDMSRGQAYMEFRYRHDMYTCWNVMRTNPLGSGGSSLLGGVRVVLTCDVKRPNTVEAAAVNICLFDGIRVRASNPFGTATVGSVEMTEGMARCNQLRSEYIRN